MQQKKNNEMIKRSIVINTMSAGGNERLAAARWVSG